MGLGLPSDAVLNSTPSGRTPSGRTPSGRGKSSGRTQQPTPKFTPTPEFGGNPMQPKDVGFDQVRSFMKAGIPQNQWQDVLRSGLEPQVWAGLGSAGQQQAIQWGTNLGQAPQIIQQQRGVFDANQQQRVQNNGTIDQFGALQTNLQDQLLGQYNSGAGFATARHDLGRDQLETGYHTDRAMLDQRQYRDVDLARQDNSAGLLHNANMRGVLDERRGIRGEMHGNQQDFLNDQIGFTNRQQDNAFARFGSNDAYLGQQGRDLMAQYGFAGREFDQNVQAAFAQRGTQVRGATSDATARGAFGSAGFGDNIQDIYGQYDRSKDAATLGLDQSTQAIDERDRAIGNDRANLRFNYTDQTIGFDRDQRGLQKAHQDNNTGLRDDLATFRGQYSANDRERSQLQNVDKGLDSLAKEFGVKRQDLKNQLDNSIDKIGLDLNETMGSLEQMLNSGNAQLQAQAMSFMSQHMAYQ